MARSIAQLGQPVLRKVATVIPAAEIPSTAIQELIDDMLDTLADAGGVGLAAPQIFESRRIFLASLSRNRPKRSGAEIEVFINPVVTPLSEEKVSDWEGCLSFIELSVLVPRYVGVRVDYLDRDGQPKAVELKGFPARVVQHENDHLDGILTIDRAVSTRDIIKSSEFEAATAEGGEV